MDGIDLSIFDENDFEENKIEEVIDEKEGNDLGDGEEIDSNLPKDAADENKDDVVDPNDDGLNRGNEDDKSDENSDNSNDDNIKLVYNNIATLLKEEGMFTNEDLDLEKIGSSDELVEALKSEIKRNEFADLSDTQKEYLEAMRNGIPEDVFIDHKKAEQTYDSISESMIGEDEALRKRIILAEFGTKNINPERAEKIYNSMLANGEDIGEALLSLQNLKALEATEYAETLDKIEQNKKDNEIAEKKHASTIKSSVYDTKEIIKNYKLTESLKDQVFENMTKAVGYNEEGQPINKLTSEREKNPVEFDTKLYYLFTMTKGFNDFSIFEKKAQSKAAEKLERIVKETNILRTGSNPIVDDEQTEVPSIVKLSNDY